MIAFSQGLRAAVCTALTFAAAAVGQRDALLGRVRDTGGEPVQLQIFGQPAHAVPWRASGAAQAVTGNGDAAGRFRVRCEGRAAVWFTAGQRGAFVAKAAAGVPIDVGLQPLAQVHLPDGSRGAHLRLDGVPVGFVAGNRLALPAGDLELLVEGPDGCHVETLRLHPGDAARAIAPCALAPRLHGAASGAFLVLPPWPERRFVPDSHGVITLPKSAAPLRATLVTDEGRRRRIDEVWITPGEILVHERAATRWQPLRVLDAGGIPIANATVVTLRTGPGRPAEAARDTTGADGTAFYRAGVERGSVVVDAPGFALRELLPIDLAAGGASPTVQLQAEHTLSLRVRGEHDRLLADVRVGVFAGGSTLQHAWTDGRGSVLLEQLQADEVTLTLEHEDHVPLTLRVDPAATSAQELHLQRGLPISGRVVCADGKARDDVLVEARRRSDPDALRRRVRAAADGTFDLRGLPAEPFDLFAWRVDRGVTWSGCATAIEAGSTAVTITIACDDPPAGIR